MNSVLHYKGYSARPEYSADDQIFYGKILGIDDLVESARRLHNLKSGSRRSVKRISGTERIQNLYHGRTTGNGKAVHAACSDRKSGWDRGNILWGFDKTVE